MPPGKRLSLVPGRIESGCRHHCLPTPPPRCFRCRYRIIRIATHHPSTAYPCLQLIVVSIGRGCSGQDPLSVPLGASTPPTLRQSRHRSPPSSSSSLLLSDILYCLLYLLPLHLSPFCPIYYLVVVCVADASSPSPPLT